MTDPSKKEDPGSPNDEFIVTLDSRLPTLTSDKDAHVFCRDGAGNLCAYRLVRKSDGSHDWQEMIGSEAENLHGHYFDHLKNRRTYWKTTPEYELAGEYGGLLLKEGKVVCGWGMDSWQLYEVTGSRMKDLRNLGLEHVDKVECLIWGAVDNKGKVVDIRDYKILKIYPKL
ncbi:MAG: hypothetical protein WCR06_04535 [bacterium]